MAEEAVKNLEVLLGMLVLAHVIQLFLLATIANALFGVMDKIRDRPTLRVEAEKLATNLDRISSGVQALIQELRAHRKDK